MKRVIWSLTLAFTLAVAPRAVTQESNAPARTQGLQAAQADIAKGLLKFHAAPPTPPLRYEDLWYEGYRSLAKHECGIELVDIKPDVAKDAKRRAETDSYNAAMLVEIEHRFGKDILNKLAEQAKTHHHLAPTLSPLLRARNRPEITGKVTVHGTVFKIKEKYAVGVGASHAHFILDQLSRTDTRRLDDLMGKEIIVKGGLRADPATAPATLVIDVSDMKANSAGPFGHKVEGEVTMSGMLTKDLWPGLHYYPPVGFAPDAYMLSQVPASTVAPVRFSGDAAKQADNLYGRNVTMQCTLASYGLGSRGQCFVYTVKDVQLDNK